MAILTGPSFMDFVQLSESVSAAVPGPASVAPAGLPEIEIGKSIPTPPPLTHASSAGPNITGESKAAGPSGYRPAGLPIVDLAFVAETPALPPSRYRQNRSESALDAALQHAGVSSPAQAVATPITVDPLGPYGHTAR